MLVFSVGGGDAERNVSANLVRALEQRTKVGRRIFGIVGRDGGFTARVADACVVIPPLVPERITPHTEGLCAVVWHLLVSHPALKRRGDELGVDRSELERAVSERFFLVGGAGFIGSHFVDRLLAEPDDRAGHRLRQLHVGSATGTSRITPATRASPSSAATSRTSRR